ncbi:MAG: acyloxyacyl hydrolase [Bacteroidia bacterium]|nr:acyloxyacyl hydrolase [Bacteroidia bacterium]
MKERKYIFVRHLRPVKNDSIEFINFYKFNHKELISKILKISFLIFPALASVFTVTGQDERSQFPSVLRNSYFEINVGYINYPFGQGSMEPGNTMKSVRVPHAAVRLVIFGHEFNKYLSTQITYMRPVSWVTYDYIDDKTPVQYNASVWMNVAGLSLKPQLPINDRFSIYGEAGICIVTRNGIYDTYTFQPILKDANYIAFLFGGGVKYHHRKKWGFMLSAAYTPANKASKQPNTIFYSAGFSYKLLPLSEKRLEKSAKTGYLHPKQMIQFGFSTNVFGYGVNNFLSKIYLFWGGYAEVRYGLSISYQRNIYNGIKVFSLDWGVSFCYWQNNLDKEHFYTISIFPVLRFTVLRTKFLDMYFFYSVAGPTYISKKIIDGHNTGENFTFQDNMGVGIFFKEKRDLNFEIKIGHYSNGNIFPNNTGVKIPLTFSLGLPF